MNSKIFYLIGIFIIILIGGFFIFGNNEKENSNVSFDNSGDFQEVVIGMKDYNYYPDNVKVKVNEPVRISLDESVYGCFRDFTIRDFGIHEYLATPNDYVEFTPTKTGTYTFACSMGMGVGTLVVED